MGSIEADLVRNRLLYYGIPHYFFILIYIYVLCRHKNNARFGHRTSLPCTYIAKLSLNLFCGALCLFLSVYELPILGPISLI